MIFSEYSDHLSRGHLIIVDVSNVCGSYNDGTCSLHLYYLVKATLATCFSNPSILGIADHKLRYHVDDKFGYYQLLGEGRLISCLDGMEADELILSMFGFKHEQQPGKVWILSNDKYRKYAINPAWRKYFIEFRLVEHGVLLLNDHVASWTLSGRIPHFFFIFFIIKNRSNKYKDN